MGGGLDLIRGGAVYGPGVLTRCTIVGNSAKEGGAVYNSTLSSCIVYRNTLDALGGSATANFCDIQGLAQTSILGQGNFDSDPLFWNAATADYHLLSGSPCVDTGNPADPLDRDGSITDVGAFAFDSAYSRVPTAFCSGDGTAGACPCANNGAQGHGCENSFATGGGLLAVGGTASVGGDTITLRASGLPPTAPCLFFQGEAHDTSGSAFGDGLVCVGSPIARLGVQSAEGGVASYGFDVVGGPLITQSTWIPPVGATRFYQAWYRNAAPLCSPATFNFTSGIGLTWTP